MTYAEAYETALETIIVEAAEQWVEHGRKARKQFAEKLTASLDSDTIWYDTLGPAGYALSWGKASVAEETWEYAGLVLLNEELGTIHDRIAIIVDRFERLREDALRNKDYAKMIQAEASYKVMDQFNGLRSFETRAKFEAMRLLRAADAELNERMKVYTTASANAQETTGKIQRARSEATLTKLQDELEFHRAAQFVAKERLISYQTELGVPQELLA